MKHLTIVIAGLVLLGSIAARAEPAAAPPAPPTQSENAAALVDQDLKTMVTTLNQSLRILNDDMTRLRLMLDADKPKPAPAVKPEAPATPPGSGQQ